MSDAGMSGPLGLSNLHSAVRALSRTLDFTAAHEFKHVDPHLRDALVSGVEQHFEFTFEVYSKSPKRQLEHGYASPAILDCLSYRDMLHSNLFVSSSITCHACTSICSIRRVRSNKIF